MAETKDSSKKAPQTPTESGHHGNHVERTPDEEGVREHAIREAAYSRFEARNGAPGDEHQDWLEAQAEVDGR